jgi:hypothetical protein
MSVRCAKCGEELLGAVNRCWKCGQIFERRPDVDGQPPVRIDWEAAAGETLDAIVLEEPMPASAAQLQQAPDPNAPAVAVATPVRVAPPAPSPYSIPRPVAPIPSTAEAVEARRNSLIAMGGTVTALVLGIFGLALSFFRFEGAVIALIGLIMGVWGLFSPKRKWALAAMLLCVLAMGLGTYRGARDLYIYIKDRQTIEPEYEAPLEP